MLDRAVPNRAEGSESEVLPAITLDVEPTTEGLETMSAQLAAFAHDHGLPALVGSRLVSVAADVADILAGGLAEPPLRRLQADADIGLADAQLVLVAGDDRLAALYASLRSRLDRIARRCDAFVAELAPNDELQVWACFRLARADEG
jgi:hypothetical protein